MVEGNKVFVSYALDAILSDDNGHGHLFAHIHKHKQKQRSEKVLCVCQGLTLFEQHDPLRGNLIQPVGESLRSFFPQFNRDTWGKHCSLHPAGSPFSPHRPQEESPLINPLIIRTHCLLKTVRRSSDGARDSCTGDKCSTVEFVLGCRAFLWELRVCCTQADGRVMTGLPMGKWRDAAL